MGRLIVGKKEKTFFIINSNIFVLEDKNKETTHKLLLSKRLTPLCGKFFMGFIEK